MKWTDDGIILSTRVFGESGRILTLLTPGHGRHAGLVRIPKTRSRLNIETGTFVEATWNARLSDHLGQWQLETIASLSARLMPFPLPLIALGSACALTNEYLPERHPYPSLYGLLKQLIEDLAYTDNWRLPYINYELALLKDLGFGLDLSACAVTGQTDNLIYISPNTGRAVSEKAGSLIKIIFCPCRLTGLKNMPPPAYNHGNSRLPYR